jgi:uncharacterized membrane protein/protein-disulfide isomerase
MTTTARRLVLLFALVGLASAGISLYVHYQLLRQPGYTSFCDVDTTVSCSSLYLSRFGSVRGVPVALLGVLWFALVLVVTVGARRASSFGEDLAAYLFALSTIGLAVILYLGYAAFFVVKAVCIMCLITYAAVMGLFVVSGIATPVPMTTLPRRMLRDLRAFVGSPVALTMAVLFAAGAATAVAFFPRETSAPATAQAQAPVPQEKRSEFQRWWESQPRMTVPVPDEGASVLVVKFTDFQCPSCGQTYLADRPVINRYEAEFPGAVKFVTKDYPLQPECNPGIPRELHSASCASAVAVRLAREHGRGDQMEEWLYTHQPSLTPSLVREMARSIGGVPDFDAQYARALEAVKADAALGRLLDVRVTPTFFINGVKVDGGLPPQYFELAIRYELQKAGKIKS